MTESSNGLRFDIYERVQLGDDALPIEALEEIELSPLIEAVELDDSILLRGHLLLSGSYSAAGANGAGALEHRIPVEISLPLSRVRRIEELDVEIDHFDVDLLSERALNVTGVLGLRGVQTEVREAPVWLEDGFTVAHEAPERVYTPEVPQAPVAGQEAALPPLGDAGSSAGGGAGFAEGAGAVGEQGHAGAQGAAGFGGNAQQAPVSQPGPVYLPPAQYAAGPGGAADAASAPVWYEQQRAQAEARAREEALLRQQAEAEALQRLLADAARAEAEREASARLEAQAREQAAREAAERAAQEAQALAEQARLSEERERQAEAEAWAQVLAYQRLEEEPPAQAEQQEPVAAPTAQAPEAAPQGQASETQVPQTPAEAGYPQVYETDIPLPASWPTHAEGADSGPVAGAVAEGDAAYAQDAAPPDGAARPEQTGPKLGLAAKKPSGSGSEFGVGILSQLGDKGAIRQADLQAAEEARQAEAAESKERESGASGDELEWTRLFLAKEAGQSFRKVRLAIVQREDTLEDIAGRYQLQTRELQLYNRLSDPHLAEGQVLYIP